VRKLIANLTLIDILTLVLVWFVSSAVYNLIFTRYVLMRYLGKALIKWISELDEDKEGREILGKLFLLMFDWIGTAEIRTGRKVRVNQEDKDGETHSVEVDEVLTPVDMLAKTISAFVFNKFRGAQGPVKAQIGRLLQEEAAGMSGGNLSPYAMMQLTKGKLGPALGELAMGYLPKKKNITDGNISGGDGESRY